LRGYVVSVVTVLVVVVVLVLVVVVLVTEGVLLGEICAEEGVTAFL